MFYNFLKSKKFFLLLALSFSYASQLYQNQQDNHQLLIDFTCATAKDELEKHPEVRTIAMVELENNFPSEFSREVLKCLPDDVAKVQLNPHLQIHKNIKLTLSKETLVIVVGDKIEISLDPKELMKLMRVKVKNASLKYFWELFQEFSDRRKALHHLSKYLILTSGKGSDDIERKFSGFLNVVQIYEENRKVIARSLDRTRNLPAFETFESSQRENLSQILFPDKTKNLNGQKLHVPYLYSYALAWIDGKPRGYWSYYLDIVAEKLSANLVYKRMREIGNINEVLFLQASFFYGLMDAYKADQYDFMIGLEFRQTDLVSYTTEDFCCILPLPKPYDLTDQILFLPMDKSCWMWLGITIAVSTLIWRISEGHWGFPFGYFSYFMGQAQLIIRIRTNRLTMKILLQLLIFAIFIFSNGYQSIITSFMLEPEKHQLLKTFDDILDSDLKLVREVTMDSAFGNYPKYQKAIMEGRVIKFMFSVQDWVKQLIEHKITSTIRCKELKAVMDRYNGIYALPEPYITGRVDLNVLPLHPYIAKFQELMDRSLEAGLHQAWTILEEASRRKPNIKKEEKEEAKELLDLGLIAPSLYILAFGLSAALVALLFEIFWKDFVTQLTKEYFKRKWKDFFGSKKQMRRDKISRKLKARKIQVRPRRNST